MFRENNGFNVKQRWPKAAACLRLVTLLVVVSLALAAPAVVQVSNIKLNTVLVAGGNVWDFAVSPDSSRVVCLADQDTDEVQELYATWEEEPPVVPVGGVSFFTAGALVAAAVSPLIGVGLVLGVVTLGSAVWYTRRRRRGVGSR